MRLAPPLSSPFGRIGMAAALVCAFAALATPAEARLAQAEMARVAVAPPPDASAPLDLAVTDAGTGRATTLRAVLDGHPVLLLPVDYTCRNVCDPMIGLSADALAATGLPGEDRRLVLFGLDPADDAAIARSRIDTVWNNRPDRPATLVADAAAVARLTKALGYRFAYDRETDSVVHPAAALVLTGDGRLARVLSPLAIDRRDLRLALTEAGEGRVGRLSDRLALLCYGFDAARGGYTPLIGRILSAAATATVIAIAGLLVALTRRRRETGS